MKRELTKEALRRYRATRKGIQTRKANAAWREHWEQVDRPAHESYLKLYNHFLRSIPVQVRLSENGKKALGKLKGGVEVGDLVAIKNWGKTVTVHVDGYANPRDYYFAFWEPILPELTFDAMSSGVIR